VQVKEYDGKAPSLICYGNSHEKHKLKQNSDSGKYFSKTLKEGNLIAKEFVKEERKGGT